MSEIEKPTLLVYPGLEFGETEKSARRYAKMLPQRRFNVVVKSARWKDPEETIEHKKERIRNDILQIGKETGRPPGVVAVSGSGPLVVEATQGLTTKELGALATIAAPLDPRGINFDSLPQSLKEKLQRQSPVFMEYIDKVMREGIPTLNTEELQRTLNIFGIRDNSAPPEFSGLDGADNRQFWTPPMPGKLGILTHAYNIARGLKSPQLTKFLTEKLDDAKKL